MSKYEKYRDYFLKYYRELRETRLLLNICVYCGCADAADGKTRCSECRKKHNALNTEWRHRKRVQQKGGEA